MNRLRVLTLNIWNRQGPWEQRLGLIRAGIARLDPDLVGLQEVIDVGGRTQADEIGEGLGYRSAFGAAHDLGGGVRFGNAALARWPIAASQRLPPPHGRERRAPVPAPRRGGRRRTARSPSSSPT